MYQLQSHSKQLTPEQVAKRQSVKTSTVYAWISRGELQSQKFEGRRYITEEQVNNFEQSRGKANFIDYRYAKGPIR